MLLSCTADHQPERASDTGGAAAAPPKPLKVLWKRSLRPFGQPVNAGGVAVLYTTADRWLYLEGRDPGTGKRLWRHQASPGLVVAGIAVEPEVVGPKSHELVAYFRPVGPERPLLATLEVVDPRSGKTVHASSPAYFVSRPTPCRRGVCVEVSVSGIGRSAWRRLDLRSGRYGPTREFPAGSRPIGPAGLVDLGGRNPEQLARVVYGRVQWRQPVGVVFPAGSSTDRGWTFEYAKRVGLLYGSVGGAVRWRGRRHQVVARVDLSDRATAGLDADTGARRWRATGTDLCLQLREDPRAPASPLLPVRCTYAGVGRGPVDDLRWRGLRRGLEGFDVETGTATWALRLPENEADLGIKGSLVLASARELLLRTRRGKVVVDLRSGGRRRPTAGERFLCMRTAQVAYREPYYVDGDATRTRYGGTLALMCDAHGRSVREPFTQRLAAGTGTRFGSATLIATKGGLAAYAEV